MSPVVTGATISKKPWNKSLRSTQYEWTQPLGRERREW